MGVVRTDGGNSTRLGNAMDTYRESDPEKAPPSFGYDMYGEGGRNGAKGDVAAHHFIPIKVASSFTDFFNDINDKYSDSKFDLAFDVDSAENGVYLPTSKEKALNARNPTETGNPDAPKKAPHYAIVHLSNHQAYSEYVKNQLKEIQASFIDEDKNLDEDATKEDRQRVASIAMGRVRNLQENLREGLAGDSADKLHFFLYSKDPELVDRHGTFDDSTDKKVLDFLNNNVYTQFHKIDPDFDKKMTGKGYISQVINDAGKVVNQFDSGSKRYIEGVANVQLLGGITTVAIIGLTVASLTKMVADYLEKTMLLWIKWLSLLKTRILILISISWLKGSLKVHWKQLF